MEPTEGRLSKRSLALHVRIRRCVDFRKTSPDINSRHLQGWIAEAKRVRETSRQNRLADYFLPYSVA